MANNYCCQNLFELINNGYLDGELVYLQRLNVETQFPMNLRFYNFCISCSQPNNEHPDDNNAQCLTFRNGVLNGKFGLYDRTANENQYAFNLITSDEMKTFAARHPNYPEQIRLRFCPYCRAPYRFQ
jgi:hypothetical protein